MPGSRLRICAGMPGNAIAGDEQAMAAAGLEPLVVVHAEPVEIDATKEFFDGGRRASGRLLDHPSRPTAVVCYNDFQAVGLTGPGNSPARLPERLSIVGWGDTPLAQIADPALTTVRVPAFEVGREAARLITELIESTR